MQTKESLLTNIGHRETEIAGYQVNIDNYTAMLKIIPKDLSTELEPYRFRKIEELVMDLGEDQLRAISDAQFHAKISGTLIMEKLEQRKAQFVCDAMKAQLKEVH